MFLSEYTIYFITLDNFISKKLMQSKRQKKTHSTTMTKNDKPFDFSVFTYVSNSFPLERKYVTINLSIPNESEECPITSMAISDPSSTSDLSFISEPNRFFCKECPRHSKATLPCGHSFSAMHLVYYWAKSAMRCPCCREGVESRVATESLPQHFRHEMARKIEASIIEDAREAAHEDQEVAMALARSLQAEGGLSTDAQAAFLISQAMRSGRGMALASLVGMDVFSPQSFDYDDLANSGNLQLRVSFFERSRLSAAVALLRVNAVLSSVLHSDREEGRRIQNEAMNYLNQSNGARSVMRTSDGEIISREDIPNQMREEVLDGMNERTYVPPRNTMRTMSQIMSGGLSMFCFSVLARPGDGSTGFIEIESSERLTLPVERLRNTRLIVPGKVQLQTRIVNDESLENSVSIQPTNHGSLSSFYVSFSDDENPCIDGISWVPNERHMHWIRVN